MAPDGPCVAAADCRQIHGHLWHPRTHSGRNSALRGPDVRPRMAHHLAVHVLRRQINNDTTDSTEPMNSVRSQHGVAWIRPVSTSSCRCSDDLTATILCRRPHNPATAVLCRCPHDLAAALLRLGLPIWQVTGLPIWTSELDARLEQQATNDLHGGLMHPSPCTCIHALGYDCARRLYRPPTEAQA